MDSATSIVPLTTGSRQWTPARAAVWLAAAEALPAEWQDLSELVSGLADPLEVALQSSYVQSVLEPYNSALLSYLRASVTMERITWWQARLAETGVETHFATCTDDVYPQLLAKAYNRPPWLFFRGNGFVGHVPAVAVVGSRTMAQGLEQVVEIVVRMLVDREVQVVSGLAVGVDTCAHRTALRSGGTTVGVVGSGLAMAYRTRMDLALLTELESAGSVVSPFTPDAPATRSSLPLRNAVISGLSIGSIVMQVGERSGTRTEMDHSLAQGRPVCVFLGESPKRPWLRVYESNELVTIATDTGEVEEAVDSWLRLATDKGQ